MVYAPGLSDLDEIAQVTASVDVPVNVLLRQGAPPVAELAAVGVARISVGGALHAISLAAVSRAAREWLDEGGQGFLAEAATGVEIRRRLFK